MTQKQVGIWIRVSTEDQASGESPEHHEQRGRYYAEAKGWRVREVYHLEAVSGKSVMGQPETARMLADIRSGRITGLIFSKLARLARNTRELLEFADIFKDTEADLISLGESIDTSTPAGRMFFTVQAALAQFEREEISERVAASVPIRAKLGKPLGGAAPFGYRWEGRELVPDEAEAPTRRRMYELFLEHRRKKTVARLLNEAGHRTRNGGKFSDTTVGRLLTDPIGKGRRRANYTKSLGEKKHWKLKPESEWVFSDVQAIVSEGVWNECNAILAAQTKKPPARKTTNLFAGFAYCSCGYKLYVPSNTPKYVCYKCKNKIPVDTLEVVFHEQLKSFVFSPKEMAEYFKRANESIRDREGMLKTLHDESGKIRREMDKLMRLYLADKISQDGFYNRNHPLEERFKELNAEIPKLQSEVDFMTIQGLSTEHLLTEAQTVYTRWPELPYSDRRVIVEQTVQRITVGNDDIRIDLAYLPQSSELTTTGQRNLTGSSRRPA